MIDSFAPEAVIVREEWRRRRWAREQKSQYGLRVWHYGHRDWPEFRSPGEGQFQGFDLCLRRYSYFRPRR